MRPVDAAVATSREGQKKALGSREKSRVPSKHGILLLAVSFYRFEFMPIAQPARYITTAHSRLCRETMSLRGQERMALLPVLAKSRRTTNPSAGRDTMRRELNFKLRDTSPRWRRISWSRGTASRTLSSVRHDKSRPVGSDTAGRGALGRD